jgi:hypothetical protein
MLARIQRVLWDWKNASWGVAMMLALAGVMVAIQQFAMFYLLLAISSLYCCGLWWKSGHVKRKSRTRKRRSPRVASRPGQLGGCVCILLLGGGVGWLAADYQIALELQSLQGRLYPASDPMPANNCGSVPSDVVVLFMGSNAVEVKTFPHPLIRVRGTPVLSLDKSPDGYMAPILEMASDDGKLIVRLDRRGFVVNRNNYLTMKRPDRSTLVVVDQYGREVLNTRYLNERAFRVTGLLHYPGLGDIPIQSPHIFGACFMVGPHGEEFASAIDINR